MKVKEVQFERGIVGRVIFETVFPTEFKNRYGEQTHGGAIAAIIDSTSWAASTAFTCKQLHSVKIVSEFLTIIPIGKTLLIEAQINKISENLVFTEVNVRVQG